MDAMNRGVAAPMNVVVPENRKTSLRDMRQCCRRWVT